MKREFLVENQSNLNIYLQKNSLSCKLYRYKDKNSYVYKFEDYVLVLEEYKDFCKLVLISKEDISLEDPIKSLKEITEDKRYSKEYIEIFGSPKSYEFDENKVFEKCDNTGLLKLALHFKMGMSSAKVFRVILYRLNQVFTLQYAMKKDLDYAKLESTHKKLLKVLKLSKNVFDKEIISKIIDDFEDLYMLLNHQDTYERFVLNFQMFIHEKSFYNLADADDPIGLYEKKDKLLKLGTV